MSRFDEVFQINRIASQVHRFWTFYESNLRNYEWQLQLFAPDFVLVSPRGSTQRSDFESSTEAGIPKSVLNAHRLKDLTLVEATDRLVHARITLEYQGKSGDKVFKTANQYEVWVDKKGAFSQSLAASN